MKHITGSASEGIVFEDNGPTSTAFFSKILRSKVHRLSRKNEVRCIPVEGLCYFVRFVRLAYHLLKGYKRNSNDNQDLLMKYGNLGNVTLKSKKTYVQITFSDNAKIDVDLNDLFQNLRPLMLQCVPISYRDFFKNITEPYYMTHWLASDHVTFISNTCDKLNEIYTSGDYEFGTQRLDENDVLKAGTIITHLTKNRNTQSLPWPKNVETFIAFRPHIIEALNYASCRFFDEL